ncbi:hypothetical protein [Ralstonia phage RP31]|uniref:Uncharacterized protein n=2 Tax=Ripduovirus RP12 TaxID=2560700 RepID=A0A1L7N0W8_9CAUD|nr:hypothetical protein FDH28_gp276 [Ralstonia phage RP12]BAW19119.1 hypothetical protein [Ralstonia phage RP12]BAW19405.1 hypothetical protein [Ralstonia phage RP31]
MHQLEQFPGTYLHNLEYLVRDLSFAEHKRLLSRAGWQNSLAKEASLQQSRKERHKRSEAKRLQYAKPLKKTRVKGIVIAR